MKCSDFIQILRQQSDESYACSWDNVGLLVGNSEKDIKKVYIALDATDEAVEEAAAEKADLLLTHHPLIFQGMMRITEQDFIGRRVIALIRADMCYYAMHTNFDVVAMAQAAADELGLTDTRVLSVTFDDGNKKEGIGRYGKGERIMSLAEWAAYVKEVFRLKYVNVYGDLEMPVETVAVCPGSGKSVVKDAVAAGADVFITGDVDHHMGIDLAAQGVGVIDAGHYGLEKIFTPYMKDFLKKEIPSIQIHMAEEKNPFYTL